MDRLALWGFSVNAEVVALGLDDAPRRSSADWRFKVKNMSSTYTARQISVHLDGADAWQLLLSTDGTVWTGDVVLGDLDANAVSAPLWLRRITPSTAATGAAGATLRAHADHWVHTIS